MANPSPLLDDCFRPDDGRMLHTRALELLAGRLRPIAARRTVALEEAAGRICAAPVLAPRDIPAFDNSAVDGYAFAADGPVTAGRSLPVSLRIAAGGEMPPPLPLATAARIFTGAPLPQGADTVAMQEDCEISPNGDEVRIPAGLKRGANRRRAGEDAKAGETIVAAGRTLRPQDIAAIASAGHAGVETFAPLRVALLSSGNELRRPGEPLALGEVYDANRFLLAALLKPLGCEIADLGIAPDDERQTCDKLAAAARSSDAVVISGGASRGEEDHVARALQALGNRHIWQIAVKPGRPMGFGQIAGTPVFGLPGNPVAAFVCFLLYVRPALILLGGGQWREPRRYLVAAGFRFPRKKTGRREFWRGAIEDMERGPVLRKFERDGSGLITGLRVADGLIEVGEDVAGVSPGDLLGFIPWAEFGIT
jgi:molybdopterin molybdotransferase